MLRHRSRLAAVTAATAVLAASFTALAGAGATAAEKGPLTSARVTPPLRVATYNASLNRSAKGELVKDLSTPDDPQAAAVAEVIQRVRPDILLINEFDYDAEHAALQLFQRNYLAVGRHGSQPITYPYRYTAPSNTGVPSGYDLNNDGSVGGPDDAYGFGLFRGQYGMAVYSRLPIEESAVRTFRQFLWKDMPYALLPDDPSTPQPADWYSGEELRHVRLSSKSHWDVPIRFGGERLHFLVSHPTPPVFDGAEDRNGRRNHDEVRFWANYVSPGKGDYIYDDRGHRGGLQRGEAFVVAGDLNSDPIDGDSLPGTVQQLLDNPLVNTAVTPTSRGAVEQARRQGGANDYQRSDPRYDTADFADVPGPGNLRTDYVLPSRQLRIDDAGVFWPSSENPLFRLVGTYPFPTSDHRLVWIDVTARV